MRRALLLLALGACVVEPAETPLHFELVNLEDNAILVDLHFDSYEQGQRFGPYTVEVTQSGRSRLVTVNVGWCSSGCVGAVDYERLELVLEQPSSGLEAAGSVGAFACEGEYGSQRSNAVIQGGAWCR